MSEITGTVDPDAGALATIDATPATVLRNAGILATALAQLIEEQGLSVTVGRDRRTNEERKHVEVGGWQAAGAMFGAVGGTSLHAETVWSRRLDRPDEVAYESRAEIRTLAGEVVGSAESLCSSAENTWKDRDEYAIKGMAETRAESRAWRRAIGWVVKLAGYSPTPAEEVPDGDRRPAPGAELPKWASSVSDDGIREVARVLVDLFKALGVSESATHASQVGTKVMKDCDGVLPVAVARVVWDIAAHHAAAGTPTDPATRAQQPPIDPATTPPPAPAGTPAPPAGDTSSAAPVPAEGTRT